MVVTSARAYQLPAIREKFPYYFTGVLAHRPPSALKNDMCRIAGQHDDQE
jgi:hypothetical protein